MTTVFIGWKPSRVGAAPSTQPRQQHGAPKLAIRIWFAPRRHNYSMNASGRLDALRASATRPGHFRPTPAPLSRLSWNLALPTFARCESLITKSKTQVGEQNLVAHAVRPSSPASPQAAVDDIGKLGAVECRPYGGMGACRFEWQTGATASKKAALTAPRSYPVSCPAISGWLMSLSTKTLDSTDHNRTRSS